MTRFKFLFPQLMESPEWWSSPAITPKLKELAATTIWGLDYLYKIKTIYQMTDFGMATAIEIQRANQWTTLSDIAILIFKKEHE